MKLGLYIHWPFCKSKCPYCDFNSHVRESIDEGRWAEALLCQLRDAYEATSHRNLSTIFFGGGTPSLMVPQTVSRVLNQVNDLWGICVDTEITMEANPTSVEVKNLQGYAAAGVNRLSLGVQSLRPEALKFLGREHSASEAMAAIQQARGIFPRYSFDLIYARPGQTLKEWEAELQEALDLAGEHLSLYQLTIEPGTAFAQQYARGDVKMPSDELSDDFFELTQSLMDHHGMPAYEVSNHAAPGKECCHNMIYWQYQEYIGVGPGAHGRLMDTRGRRLATVQLKTPEAWLAKIEEGDATPEQMNQIEQADLVYEMMMMGLRIRSGIDLASFQQITGMSFEAAFPREKMTSLCDEGYCRLSADKLEMTIAGLKNVNSILRFLFD
ncbi:MAG: hypothetical protein BGO28_02625 [Alphaproteobacteria bacterium 43-37]|nr:MAG: hypothetical protein BGO28_02625 [Alphaproteobacteria bacterium 43-37]